MQITELLELYNIPMAPSGHHHTTEGWVQFDCPFCGRDSHKYHMGYNMSAGFVNCWQCGAHSLASVLHEYTDQSYQSIHKTLQGLDRMRIAPTRRETKGYVTCPKGVDKLKTAHLQYLRNRGFDPAEIEKLWQVRGLSVAGRLSWRLFIPIHYKAKMVSWTTRSLNDQGQRYLSAAPDQEILPHKDIPYGWDYVRHTVIIVEGPLDVWAIGPGAAATFGTNYTPAQVHHFCDVPRRVVCFDSSFTAQRQAKKLCDQLGVFPGETINITLDAKDPAEAKPREIKHLRKFLE